MSRGADAIIIGAGIIGAACARALASAGRSVLVIDSRGIAGGATGAGMGHIVMMDDPPEEFALVRRSMELWDEVAPRAPKEAAWNRRGTLWVATDSDELAEAKRKHARLRASGISAELLDGGQVARAEPGLRSGLAGGLRVPGDSVLLPPIAAKWMLADILVRTETAVTAIRAGEVELEGGECVTSPVIVNAAGMWGRELTPGLPLVAKKGHLVMLGGAAGLCEHQIVELGYIKNAHGDAAESVSFNVQPRADGTVVVGSSRQMGVNSYEVEPRVRDRMIKHAASFMPGLAGLGMVREWAGVRAASRDGLPIIGAHPHMPGVYLAGGHEGLGLTTTLATAEIIANAILGRQQAIDPLPYSPARFAAVLKA